MLRLKVLASVVPLAFAAAFARGELFPSSRPCIEIGDTAVQMAVVPWLAGSRVSFTDDPERATVRVQITDTPEAADFTVIDDIDTAEGGACAGPSVPQTVAISSTPTASEPVIYLTADGPADYHIFVRSKGFSVRDAAALIVGATGGRHRVHAAAL